MKTPKHVQLGEPITPMKPNFEHCTAHVKSEYGEKAEELFRKELRKNKKKLTFQLVADTITKVLIKLTGGKPAPTPKYGATNSPGSSIRFHGRKPLRRP